MAGALMAGSVTVLSPVVLRHEVRNLHDAVLSLSVDWLYRGSGCHLPCCDAVASKSAKRHEKDQRVCPVPLPSEGSGQPRLPMLARRESFLSGTLVPTRPVADMAKHSRFREIADHGS